MSAAGREAELRRRLRFVQELEGLKSVTRTAWTRGGRRESTPEHSWRLAMLCWCVADLFAEVDVPRALLLCLVHDLGELDGGDVSAALRPDPGAKEREEERTVRRLAALLPEERGAELEALCREYREGRTPEARLVRALDKAETILQHAVGDNPPDFDWGFNLEYGAAYFEGDERLEQLRALLDEETRGRMERESDGE